MDTWNNIGIKKGSGGVGAVTGEAKNSAITNAAASWQQMGLWVLILLFTASGFSVALAGGASQAEPERTCLAITSNDSSYMVAVGRVTSIPMAKDWIASLGGEGRMALGWDDKTEFRGGALLLVYFILQK